MEERREGREGGIGKGGKRVGSERTEGKRVRE